MDNKELERVPKILSANYNAELIQRLYEVGGGVAMDIIIFLCGEHSRNLFGEVWFSLEDFCKKMGYERTKLQRKLTPQQLQNLFGKQPPVYVYVSENGAEYSHQIETVFEAALYRLGRENIAYRTQKDGRTSYNFVQIINRFDIESDFSTKKGTKRLYNVQLNPVLRYQVQSYYNLIESKDYRILPDRKGYRLFYLELSKMICLIKFKAAQQTSSTYTLTVDQLAVIFNVKIKENKDKKKKVTAILNTINKHLEYTKFKFEYIKGEGEQYAYTVLFTFNQETLDYFDEQYKAIFIKRLEYQLFLLYLRLGNISQEQVKQLGNSYEDMLKNVELYSKYLSWKDSEENKLEKEQTYRCVFFDIFGEYPETFGLTIPYLPNHLIEKEGDNRIPF